MMAVIASGALSSPALGQNADANNVRSSAAYAEVKLRRTEVEADVEALSADYTPQSPRMLDLKAEAAALDTAIARLIRAKPSDPVRFTASLGRLLVKHAALTVEVTKLLRTYAPEHQEVMRAKRRVEVFDRTIKEMLP